MEESKWPGVHNILGHEAGNMISGVVIAEPSIQGKRRTWEEGNEVIEIYKEFSSAIEEGDEDSAEEALSELRRYDSPATPEYPRKKIQKVLSLIDAARSYDELLCGGGEATGEMELGEVLEPFEWYEDIRTDYDPEVTVRGECALRLVSNTMIKNWKEHAKGGLGTNMWVEMEEYDDRVELEVYDDGPGIQGAGEELFEVDPDDSDSYYGLAFARELVEEFDGSLDYYEPETGGMGHEWELEKH